MPSNEFTVVVREPTERLVRTPAVVAIAAAARPDVETDCSPIRAPVKGVSKSAGLTPFRRPAASMSESRRFRSTSSVSIIGTILQRTRSRTVDKNTNGQSALS